MQWVTFVEMHVKWSVTLTDRLDLSDFNGLGLSDFNGSIGSQKLPILRNDPETKHMFYLPPLISFKRDKNLGNFLVRSAFEFDNQPGTFTCKQSKLVPLFLTQF